MNDKTGKIILEGDTLYRLDFWTKVFDEDRSKGATEYVSIGLGTIETFFRDKDPCPFLLDGLEEYKRLRATGVENGILKELIDRMRRELGRKAKRILTQ